MMALALPAAPSFPHCSSSSSSKFTTSAQLHNSLRLFPCRNKTKINDSHAYSKEIIQKRIPNFICRAEKEYKFPDPIPEFADAETEKFRTHLDGKLSKKDMFGDSVNEVVDICTQIFSDFLHTEYGGPGTLLVMPFIDMADTINERGLPGGPQAARAAVKWAQKYVDKDWKEWTNT